MIRQCCQCKRVWKDGRWAYARLSQLENNDVSHGYCEDCFSKQVSKIERQRASGLARNSWLNQWMRFHH